MSPVDPGIGGSISGAAEDVEAKVHVDHSDDAAAWQRQEEAEEAEEADFLAPSKWWFASTACPLLAGTFGPVASGFSICALSWCWRVSLPPGVPEEHGVYIEDPAWLIALNAVSLVFAVLGNATLLLNMTQRMPFHVAQPMTITGFLLAGVLLIADVAAVNASSTYWLRGDDAPGAHHALTSAYYYALWAAVFYMLIGFLMCFTVYGANKGYYEKDFHLTPPQRTLMIQTMYFVAYLLLGALVFSHVEDWEYLNAVYWADVTVLTVGLGDFSPRSRIGKGLLFPFALGGVLTVGLVVGSIRSLVLERGREKMSARITEKRRSDAIHDVDERKQTIKISWLAAADFSTNPSLSPAQRREEEFNVMRKVQRTAERERRWFSLLTSITVALSLWLSGAAVFMVTERAQQWTYFDSVYFTFVCLLTIGYGDYSPHSNAGRAFFVMWSLMAVPSLTILISNMGDTFVRWFSDATLWLGSITVLPTEKGFEASTRTILRRVSAYIQQACSHFTLPGFFGGTPNMKHEERMSSEEHERQVMDCLAERLTSHIEREERDEARQADREGDELERDTRFYHYVLARECRNLQKDLGNIPNKQYTWQEWEYFLKLIGNEDDSSNHPGPKPPVIMVPDNLRTLPSTGSDATMTDAGPAPERVGSGDLNVQEIDLRKQDAGPTVESAQNDGVVGRLTEVGEWKKKHEANKRLRPHPDREHGRGRHLTTMDVQNWSWLSSKSPLMCSRSETEWILEHLSAALVRELNRQRKGYRQKPPISMSEIRRRSGQRQDQGQCQDRAGGRKQVKQDDDLEKAAKSAA
ncbi:putative potassium channel isoform 2A [Teratosphaeria destructans]|uniref:Potassium channel isoform 2A n=1 Tax=Teratosphaeria destructans TaxID=418781 RepID=A0A9W7STZ8_9PEZI|nr:putative potassium channel isoform 2A [Teratosphaeria destructans]